MKVITLWQPWASLMAEGVKTIETRGRPHPWRAAIGETIAIHAAQRPMKQAVWSERNGRGGHVMVRFRGWRLRRLDARTTR